MSRSRFVVVRGPRSTLEMGSQSQLYTLAMGLLRRATSWYYARSVQNLAPGDVCSIKSEDGFSVAKVLAKSSNVVHVRIYKEKFAIRPDSVGTSALSLGSIHDPDGFGVGHIPLSCATFGSWLPAKFRSEPVTDDEFIWVTEWGNTRRGRLGLSQGNKCLQSLVCGKFLSPVRHRVRCPVCR